MYILIGLGIEFLSIMLSSSIIINGRINALIEISKMGYKIDKDVIDEYQNGKADENNPTSYKLKTIINTILLVIPGINLISATIRSIRTKKMIFKDIKIMESLVPMSEEEKSDFSKLESKAQKLLFVAFTSTKNNDDERIFAFIGNKPLVVDYKLTSIYQEPLPYYAYTYDEVKRLNKVTNGIFKVGKVDGRCIAIVGITDENYQIKRISFRNEDWENIHDFIEIDEEDAKKKTYIVYPYIHDDVEKLKEMVEKIIKDRKNKLKENNIGNNHQEFISNNIVSEKPKILSLNPLINNKKS